MAKPAQHRLRQIVTNQNRGFAGIVAVGAVPIGVGLWLQTLALTALGLFITLAGLLDFRWQRDCLKGVSYRRTLSQHHALFGEELHLGIEICNDKLLPLTWLCVRDKVPQGLPIRGGDVVEDEEGISHLVHLQPVLSRSRLTHDLTLCCDRRGVFYFGPSETSSGDPLGTRTHYAVIRNVDELLVYPKVFLLAPRDIASRVVIGETRSRYQLIDDPSRISGMREYRPGDPLRRVDWRATARTSTLLVREFDPTVALRAAVFLDIRESGNGPALMEFAIAVAASFVSEFCAKKIPTGLFSSATVGGRSIVFPPSSSPEAEASMLEALARASAVELWPIDRVVTAATEGLRNGTSAIVIASDFRESTLVSLANLRRRHAVTAVWIRSETGSPPPREFVDALFTIECADDWQHQDVLELAA